MNEKPHDRAGRIALGTVQIGLDYGINEAGKVQIEEVRKILSYAREYQIDTLDTAIAYGDSEKVLGEADVSGCKIVTKLPVIPKKCKNIEEWVESSVCGSLERLRVPKLYGLLLHCPGDLLGEFGQKLYSGLRICKDKGLVRKIGISVYAPSELETIIPRFTLDLIQAPFNVIDRRLETSGWISRLHESGKEIHARSVFLQGLLLMQFNRRPKKFDRWKNIWVEWDTWLKENQVSALHACFQFILSYPQIDRVIVGVDRFVHLEEIVECLDSDCPNPPGSMACNELELIIPGNWKHLK